jgi:hypothetical protein
LKSKVGTYLFWIVLVYISLEAYRAFVYHGIKKNKIGFHQKLNEVFEGNTNYDQLIIGSSRAESHISPAILDSALNTRTFNLGIPGSFAHQQLIFLDAYLQKHPKPKTILLSADIHVYTNEANLNSIHDFNRYFPYLDNQGFYEGLERLDSKYFYYKYFAPYSLAFDKKDEQLNHALRGYFGYSENTLAYTQGFAFSPYATDKNHDLNKVIRPYFSYPSRAILYAYENLDHFCRENGIQLILVFTPIYKNLRAAIKNEENVRLKIKQFFRNHRVLDYTYSELSERDDCFIDASHLNKKGALLFSRQLSIDLQQFLGKKTVK